ncbi:MAG: 5-formyltetrahydrofolate cyclo-ligase [Candidatus Paracaedibacteraceae bacterium]|nr:5-formyltetrahydrofolate cyclo-ligase [Candidatus Paracaedibacteraceae bacterium]
MGVEIAKQALRPLLRQRRQNYHALIVQTDIDQKLLKQWQELRRVIPLKSSQIIAGYVPRGSELNILALMAYLYNQGHVVCVPQLTPTCQLDFIAWSPISTTSTNSQLFSAPSHEVPLTPHIALVPLLGFDARGNRLGQGKGYYDRSLSKNIIAIGVGYDCQQLDNIPVCDKDYPMDYIVTPEKIFILNKDLR